MSDEEESEEIEEEARSDLRHVGKEHDMSNSDKRACGCRSDCCGGEKAAKEMPTSSEASAMERDVLRQKVRAGYAKIAEAGVWSSVAVSEERDVGAVDLLGGKQIEVARGTSSGGCCGGRGAESGGMCCGPSSFSAEELARAIGYSQHELEVVPVGANMGLSCGNPTAIAELRAGEVVLDLGAGGGFDCFVAGAKVGAAGRVIGVDMTSDMVSKARGLAAMYREQTGLSNVEFRLGEIEHLPVADASVDVVISNCVLNLSPAKDQVWREIARVLKPGGRVAVSDLALLRPLPEAIAADVEALVGCVAGAVLVDQTRADAVAAGLIDLRLLSRPGYIEAMERFEDPLYQKIVGHLPEGMKVSDFVTSLEVTGRKSCER
jgi:arsenite methyltransferase